MSAIELQVGVKVLLKNPKGKYLVIRRTTDKYQEVLHKWDIPGGRINVESTLVENLEREVMEETGLRMSTQPRLVAAQDLMPNDLTTKHVVRLTYVGEANGAPTLSEEHTEYKWLSFDQLISLENLDKYLKQLLDGGIISEASYE